MDTFDKKVVLNFSPGPLHEGLHHTVVPLSKGAALSHSEEPQNFCSILDATMIPHPRLLVKQLNVTPPTRRAHPTAQPTAKPAPFVEMPMLLSMQLSRRAKVLELEHKQSLDVRIN